MQKEPSKEENRSAKSGTSPAASPVYPSFLFKEFLVALACLLVLAWLGLLFDAPIDTPADPEFTPNPAKAPWYFLGIQELLVYFDPWLAGVVIPLLIVSGLIIIPFIDNDPSGAGYYSIRHRCWTLMPFTAGLLMLILLTVTAAWFRGSNWDWYWPWQSWGMAKPARPGFRSLMPWLGWSLFIIYYLLGLVLPYRLWPNRFATWGRIRYLIYFTLVLTMAGVALKVVLRLVFNIRYLVQTPWFNI